MDTADNISGHGIGLDSQPARRLYDELSSLTVIDAHEPDARARAGPAGAGRREPVRGVSVLVLQVSGMPAADLQAMRSYARQSGRLYERTFRHRMAVGTLRDYAFGCDSATPSTGSSTASATW